MECILTGKWALYSIRAEKISELRLCTDQRRLSMKTCAHLLLSFLPSPPLIHPGCPSAVSLCTQPHLAFRGCPEDSDSMVRGPVFRFYPSIVYPQVPISFQAAESLREWHVCGRQTEELIRASSVLYVVIGCVRRNRGERKEGIIEPECARYSGVVDDR
ncbi:uncharacterized protein EI90DRAFT_522621 [Cantharellus anzutake]|uniref:uncharacterized protein n=1 Tax=Cantharellus anzutake TaxID=1750568 RepID=UPI0019054EFC|nr:uncharacterized protein EI90DRAFT_522621 [Cantharellus anzutake]KAF8334187.1 hypothetical protein EI90DRAFT_522621 [Cantharellus anzutake]